LPLQITYDARVSILEIDAKLLFELANKYWVAIYSWGKLLVHYYRWTSLYARDRYSKNRLAYNEFAYKKIKNDCKLEVRFQKKGHFRIAYTRNRR